MKIKDLVEKHGDLELSEYLFEQLGIEIKIDKFKIPEKEELYYYITASGKIGVRKCENDSFDEIIISTGNYYSLNHFTLEEVEQIARQKFEYDKAVWELEREIERLNDGWVPGWSVNDDSKLFIYYDHEDDVFGIDSVFIFHSRPERFFLKSEELCKQLIKTHSKQLKTYLGIKR